MHPERKADQATGRKASANVWLPVAVVAVAVVVRLVAVTAFPLEPVADASDYHGLAVRLTDGLGFANDHGEPTAVRGPLYPAFLASTYLVLGADPHRASAVQAVLGGVTVALLMWFGWLTVGYVEGLAAGFLAAVYPGVVWLPRALLSENLIMPLLLFTLCGAAMLVDTRRSLWAAVTGASLAFATLTRTSTLFVVPLLCLGLLLSMTKKTGLRRALGMTLVTVLTFCACLAPWAYRNHRVFGQGPLLSTSGGITLYASYWPPRVGAKRIWGNLPGADDPAIAAAARSSNEATGSAQLTRVTIERLMAKPVYFFSLWPVKTMWLLAPFDWDWFPREPGRTRSFNLGYVLLLLPALVGLVNVLAQPTKHAWLLWLLPTAVLLQALIFYGGPRFRLPAEASLLILAGAGFARVLYEALPLRIDGSRGRHDAAANRAVRFLNSVKGFAYSVIDTLTRPWGLRRRINRRSWRLSAKCWRTFPENWEADLDRFFDEAVRPGMIIADVGAHVGIHTLSLAQRVGRGGHVYAFEPVPNAAVLLRRHLKLNKLDDRVTVVESAVGEFEGYEEMDVDPVNADPGNSFVTRPYAPAPKRLRVRVVTLAGFFKEQNLCPSLIKIDVEGYELRVLRGSTGLLRGGVVLACAVHPWHLQQLGESEEQLFREAEERGLEVVTLQGQPVEPEGTYREVILRPASGR